MSKDANKNEKTNLCLMLSENLIKMSNQEDNLQENIEFESKIIKCLSDKWEYPKFFEEVSFIIKQQNKSTSDQLLSILDKNFLDIEKLPDQKKDAMFYLKTI